MDKNDTILIHRFYDLAKKSNRSERVVFSNFLNLNEQNLLMEEKNNLEASFQLFGGFSNAERQIACFQSDAFSLYNESELVYPIHCIHIWPANKKFSEPVNHRDILGSLMHLGIERDQLGDIIVDESDIYVMCLKTACSLILEDLYKIRHTQMRSEEIALRDFKFEPSFEEKTCQIASNRLDAFVASVCNLSRQKANEYILSEKVFINSKLITNLNASIKENDVISLRGYGKLRIESFLGTTKKGKIRISYQLYT